jgi:hypothetical protein
MNLRRRRAEPVEVKYIFRKGDGSTEEETVEAAAEAQVVEPAEEAQVVEPAAETQSVELAEESQMAELADEARVDEPVAEGALEQAADGSAASSRRPSLSALLIEAGLASDEQIHEALEEGTRTGEKLGEVVVRRGWASEARLAQLLAEQWGLRAVDPGALSLDPLAVNRIEIGVAAQLGGFPVWFDEQGIVVAVAEPTEDRFAAFREQLGNVSFVVVSRSTLKELVESRLFGAKGKNEGSDHVRPESESSANDSAESAENGLGEAPSGNGDRAEPVAELAGYVVGSHDQPGESPPIAWAPAPAVGPAQGSVVEKLRAIEAEVQALEEALGEVRATLDARDAELAAVREAHEQDLARVRALEAELAERSHRLESLRQKVADLNLAFHD